jgi:tetratricopeptide (TPR) repeat protein
MRKQNTAALFCGVTALWLSPALAQESAQAPQALFNAAQAASERNDWPNAVKGFRAALAAINSSSRSAPVIHARLANALQQTHDFTAAQQEAKLSISGFAAQNVVKDDDLSFAHFVLATGHRGGPDNERAISEYQQALASAADTTSAALMPLRYGLALATTTAKPDLAASTIDAVLADQAFLKTLPKNDQADIYSLRSLADLNRGQAKTAASYIEKALDLTGRTTTKVTVRQTRVRGNAALIYSRLGNEENVRQYLTYSGAGHLPDANWLSAAEKNLPVCDDQVSPKDFAVVEFSIADDGKVIGANAVYASRPGPVGAVFAAAVNNWQWRADALAKLNPFWRSSIRVELRCVKRPPLLNLGDSFRDATADWLTKVGYDPTLSKPTFNSGAVTAGAVPAAFAEFWKADGDRAVATAASKLNAALVSAKAPIEVRGFILFMAATPQRRETGHGYALAHARNLTAALQMLDHEVGAERVRAWLQAEIGLALENGGALPAARTMLQMVAASPKTTLPDDDPIRSLAVLHLALIDKRSGNAVFADQRIKDAGIDAEQCSLLNVRPIARNTDISSSAFPDEALRWHFEGNVREAFDIGPDGHVEDVRTVLSYPPFVFGSATEKAVAQFRYLPPTLDNKVLGCVGNTVNVNYRLPE